MTETEARLPETLWADVDVTITDRLDTIITLLRELVRELKMERNR